MGTQQSVFDKELDKDRHSGDNNYFHRNDAFVMMKMEEDDGGGEVASQEFHNNVRENIIFLLFFLTLIGMASMVIDLFASTKHSSGQRRVSRSQQGGKSNNNNNQHSGDDDESVVKRICCCLCKLTLSASFGATLLLPISIVSNEVLLLYPTNSYLEWLNGMLIQGLWNLVFLFSNIGLFILLPFAHLFIEAEGFSGKKRGLISKIQETVVILTLLSFTVWGISVIVNSFFITRGSNVLFHFNQLPFIYSCISFIGVLVLTLCTPLGLSRLFTVLSANFVFVPEFLRNLEVEYDCAVLEHENLKNQKERRALSNSVGRLVKRKIDAASLEVAIEASRKQISQLKSLRTTPPWKRNMLYPGLFITVLTVTAFTVCIVMINAIKIVAGFRDLSLEVVAKETLPIGRSSLSFLGPGGAIFEIILVVYLMTSSLIGLYSLPVFRNLTPVRCSTPTTHIISNCAIVLVLSSALPVFMRILGLTNFDLLGTYAGKIDWIENSLIVVFVNLLFAVLTIVILVNKVTHKIRFEIMSRFRLAFCQD